MDASAFGQSINLGGGAFVTTHWSVVLEAQGRSATAQAALEKLCRTYWRPLYSFVRRQGRGPEDAQDLQSCKPRDGLQICKWVAFFDRAVSTLLLNQFRDQAGPACLMARAKSFARVRVEVLVE